jgi:hypothetical protein
VPLLRIYKYEKGPNGLLTMRHYEIADNCPSTKREEEPKRAPQLCTNTKLQTTVLVLSRALLDFASRPAYKIVNTNRIGPSQIPPHHNRGGSKTDYIRAEKHAKPEEKDRLNLRGSYLEPLYKRHSKRPRASPRDARVENPG